MLTTRSTKRLCLVGSQPRYLHSPLVDLEEEVAPEPTPTDLESADLHVDNVEIKQEEPVGSVVFEDLDFLRPPIEVPHKSIVEICKSLNVNLTQASGEFLEGHWIFAGTSQIRCHECGEKPQLVFVKHSTSDLAEHLFAFGCSGCAVVRSHESSRYGELSLVQAELKIEVLLSQKCPECRNV